MGALIAFEKKVNQCESDAARVHLIENYASREDWKGLNLAIVQRRLQRLELPGQLSADVGHLVHRDDSVPRSYECEYCRAVYCPFTVICPDCFTVNMGTPIRGGMIERSAELFSTCGLNLGALEVQSWELHLTASEVDSGDPAMLP
jgi:hypothetical protein